MIALLLVGGLIAVAFVLLLSISSSGKRAAVQAERVALVVEKDEEFSPEVIAFASQPDGLVRAIKQYRLETGASLDAARPKIQGLMARLRNAT